MQVYTYTAAEYAEAGEPYGPIESMPTSWPFPLGIFVRLHKVLRRKA